MENYDEIFTEVQRYIEDNYSRKITLADFVQAKGISTRSTQRALSWRDTNWQRLLLDYRMSRAKELLRHSGETIGSVATMVGYDHSQFTRTFTAEEGMGPEEYKQQYSQ